MGWRRRVHPDMPAGVTIGTANVSQAAGQVRKLTVALTSTGRKLLKQNRSLAVTVTGLQAVGGGQSLVAMKTVTLRAAQH